MKIKSLLSILFAKQYNTYGYLETKKRKRKNKSTIKSSNTQSKKLGGKKEKKKKMYDPF